MILIAFTGCQSTGKTTLLNKMKKDPRFKDFQFYDEITRKVLRDGMKINTEGNDETQRAIIASHWTNVENLDSTHEPVGRIMDRWALDGYVYTNYLFNKSKVNLETFDLADELLVAHLNKFDYVFYLTPEFDIVNDGVRSDDIKFRDDIAKMFDDVIREFDIDVIHLTGTIEERYNKMMEVLENGK